MSGALQMLMASGGVLDTQTVTTGSSGVAFNRFTGYRSSPVLGSISTGTSNLLGGAPVRSIYWGEGGGGGGKFTVFELTGTFANSGWAQMKVGATTYLRSSASFLANAGVTQWVWPAAPFASQPFVGTVTVTFT